MTDIRNRLAPNDECVVLWQGLIFPYKGIGFLLDAWVKVQAAGANARLVIAGTGSSEILAEITAQAERLGIAKSVRFEFRFLPLEEMIGFYQAAHVLVYPYKAITTSGALMTGLTQGKAIVATSLPAFQDILEDGKNALLIAYGDVDGFANRLLMLIRDPELRDRLARCARALNLGDNMWNEIARRTLACYAAVANPQTRE
jgi:glycosyltransferase involved in cell wall biosynthesis